MRDYDTILAELHSRPRYAKKKDLSRITNLMNALGNPQNHLSFVHVAGTNGKGSICAMTASILRSAGKKTGLFTSPYLKEFTERIMIDGNTIPKTDFCRIYERVYAEECALESSGQEPANEFEVITAIAMCYYYEQQCDVVVLEVGLGGRLDATNIIAPQKVCCIAQLGLDHQAQLGNTIEEIAAEKGGIIKQDCIVITPSTQAPEAIDVLSEICRRNHAELRVCAVPSELRLSSHHTSFLLEGKRFYVSLAGPYQAYNAACAIEIGRALGISDELIQKGLTTVVWPARLMPLTEDVVLDCAHNPNGIQALLDALDAVYPGRPICSLMAMMADKDYKTCVRAVAERSVRLTATTLDMPRALSSEELRESADGYCLKTYSEPNPEQALKAAMLRRRNDELLVICGSVYLAGEILSLIDQHPGILHYMKRN